MRSNFTPWIYKAGGLGVVLTLAIWASGSLYGAARSERAVWQAKFARPVAVSYPADNPYSQAKAHLGRMLFYDPILSGSQKISCADCHDPARSWQDNRARGFGEKQMATRTPTLLNVATADKLGWIGQFRDLEAVAFTPISSPIIMNLPEQGLIERLSALTGYVNAFDAAFGKGPVTRRKIELALATFERSIVSNPAPFDRWIKGDEKAIDASAKRGFDLFVGKARCVACHTGWTFSDASFHDIGSAKDGDIGRAKLFPSSVGLKYAFKTPTLRDVAKRPPYMHDGSLVTLEEVIELYDRGGIERPSRDPDIVPLKLSADEKADLIAFLKTLSAPAQPAKSLSKPPALPR